MTHRPTHSPSPVRDRSGYRIFAAGQLGAAHVMAHEMLDAGTPELGYRLLKEWLRGRAGTGSQWLHLQWHMLVFELAVGRIDDAIDRLYRELVPAAATTDQVLTDAPAALWRIHLAAPGALELPWQLVAATARDQLDRRRDPYVTLHNLLALAGAGDTVTIDRWLAHHRGWAPHDQVLRAMALAFRCHASGDFDLAAAAFAAGLPGLPGLGGSAAQNQLFIDLYRDAKERRVAATDNPDDVSLWHAAH